MEKAEIQRKRSKYGKGGGGKGTVRPVDIQVMVSSVKLKSKLGMLMEPSWQIPSWRPHGEREGPGWLEGL